MEGPADSWLRKWWPLIEARARKYEGVGGVEFDDLVQEGAISVWKLRDSGYVPTATHIDRALLDYIRAWTHRGQGVHAGGSANPSE